jgi:polyphosphate kinase
VSAPSKTRRKEPDLFLNRELSWLAFNQRVLEEAMDAQTPLLERLKFATITAGNLDEFFMVRVAALKHAVDEGDIAPDSAGLTPGQQLQQIAQRAHEMVERLYKTLMEEIVPALGTHGIHILTVSQLDAAQRAALSRHFQEEVQPALTPLAIDSSRPFPHLSSLSLNLGLLLAPTAEGESPRLAVVQVPSRLPRLVRPIGAEGTSYVFLEDVIRTELASLFPGQTVLQSTVFRISRDAEMELDDEGALGDYLEELEEELRKRRRSRTIRLELDASVGDTLLAMLTERLGVDTDDVYRVAGPLDLRALSSLVELPSLESLRDPPLRPAPVLDAQQHENIFDVLDERDVLLHHPYESFDSVVAFVSRAADDPDVLAIKQTLYRTSGESPIVQALARAADQGRKQVTVLVELMARFDEQSNIRWARSLEESGAHVIYGIRGYKTHSKICLVVRRGRRGIRRYVHLGTGNYNDKTARLYTDFGLMTSDPEIGEDASAFFNALTGYSDPPRMKKLVMAPTALRERFLRLIEREKRRAEAGQAAEIRAKMNALVDEDVIRALYEASKAGVRIRLNVRGICCLRPGLRGVSENIDVVSVVDRFLEHARIFYFRNGGDEEVYMASADWMPRNLDRRIELMFPIESVEARQKAMQALDSMFLDNVKSRWLQADGTYKRRRPAKGEDPFRVQLYLHREAQRAIERARAVAGVTFEPVDGGGQTGR